jgi:DNA-binding NtrC family response regulator
MTPDMMKVPLASLLSLPVGDVFGDRSVGVIADLLQAQEAQQASAPSIEGLASAAFANGGARGILKHFERAIVVTALEQSKGNISAAARLIGVDRKAFERRMARHQVGRRG